VSRNAKRQQNGAPSKRTGKRSRPQPFTQTRDLQRQGDAATSRAEVAIPDGPIMDKMLGSDQLLSGGVSWRNDPIGNSSLGGWFSIAKGDDGRITPMGLALIMTAAAIIAIIGGVVLASTEHPGPANAVFALAVVPFVFAFVLALRELGARSAAPVESARQAMPVTPNERTDVAPINRTDRAHRAAWDEPHAPQVDAATEQPRALESGE